MLFSLYVTRLSHTRASAHFSFVDNPNEWHPNPQIYKVYLPLYVINPHKYSVEPPPPVNQHTKHIILNIYGISTYPSCIVPPASLPSPKTWRKGTMAIEINIESTVDSPRA